MIDWTPLLTISETLAYAMSVLAVSGLAVRLAQEIIGKILNHNSTTSSSTTTSTSTSSK